MTTPKADLRYAGLTHTGRVRTENEDRIYMDPERGLFLVADGLGGHAAGERAAETAVEMIAKRLARKTGSPEERMREAIAVANNEIHALAQTRDDWKGMACVVSAALIEDGAITIGHVGDSRVYLLDSSGIRKVTKDHSPVGEMEDSGKLSEAAAMAHPRRNEVFRDLGSEPHSPDDDEFIEILNFPFRPDAALLICSDGLSDQVTAERIRRTVEDNARDPERAVNLLVAAANEAGGKDNVSVVLAQGRDYARVANPAEVSAPAPGRGRLHPVLAFLAGALLMLGIVAAVRPYAVETPGGLGFGYGTVRGPITWRVKPGENAIGEACKKARAGDTILVEPGTYRESVRVPAGVALLSTAPHGAIVTSPETAILAEGIQGARLDGFKILGPGKIGVRIESANIEVTGLEITTTEEAGIAIDGASAGLIRANTIVSNSGAGIIVRGSSTPSILNNVITGNGKAPGGLRPGVAIDGEATPVLAGNTISDSGAEQIRTTPLVSPETLFANNFIAPGVKDRKGLIKVVTR